MTENKRSRGLVVAVVVLVLLVGVSLVALLLNRDGDNGAGQAAAPPAGPTAAQPSATSSPAAEIQPPLTAAPAGVSWELVQGVALPTSRTDGPTRVYGPVHAGFSHTPTGALLAAEQVGVRSVVELSVTGLRQIAQDQLVDGAGKTAWLNLLSQLKENNPPASGYAQIVGFRYLTYTPDVAVISTATRDKAGRVQVGTDTLRWVEGDWKLEKPASGLQQPQIVQSIAGYVPWSGVS